MTDILVNGVPTDRVAALDRGFQYGDGLFETLAVRDGAPLLWDRHLQRLFRGAARLAIPAPAAELLRAEAGQICRDIRRGILKIVLTRGISGRGYAPAAGTTPTRTVGLLPWPDYPAHHRTQGVAAQFCRTLITRHNVLAGLKHLNRLEQVLARMEMNNDCAEGLMRDETGHVVEGTMTNLFIVADTTLITPDLTHSGVEGVMRNLVLERAAGLALNCCIAQLTPEAILAAEEIFLTNSLIGVWPVRRLEGREYEVGRVTRKIQDAIHDACIVD